MKENEIITIMADNPIDARIVKAPDDAGVFEALCDSRIVPGQYVCLYEDKMLDILLISQEKNKCVFNITDQAAHKDRRKYVRYPFNRPVDIRLTDSGQWEKVVGEDISGGGMGVRCENTFPVGANVVVALPVMEIPGEVCWNKKGRRALKMGIMFTVDDYTRDKVVEFIQEVNRNIRIYR